nr:unnamed protein product [Spirometra erinaceieuropaei]
MVLRNGDSVFTLQRCGLRHLAEWAERVITRKQVDVSVDRVGVRHPRLQQLSPCLVAGSRQYPRVGEVELMAILQRDGYWGTHGCSFGLFVCSAIEYLNINEYLSTNSHITNPDTTTDTTPTSPDSSDEDRDYTCAHCDRTFTSHIGLVGHLRIHRTDSGETVPGAPTYTHRTRLYCPHCPRTFTHCMGLFGHMRIHESGIDRNTDSFIMPNPTSISSLYAPTALPTTDTGSTEFTCPHCPRTFTSRIGLLGRLPIHRTETGEPVPGAPTYTHHTHSAAHTLLAPSGIAWTYSATCASTTTCGKQPPTTPNPLSHPLPSSSSSSSSSTTTITTISTTPPHINTHPPHAPNYHLPRNCFWKNVAAGPPDVIFGLNEAYDRDPNPKKVNLGAGAYRDDEGLPFVLSAVRTAEARAIIGQNKEYLPISGNPNFCHEAIKLALGSESPVLLEKREKFAPSRTIWLPTPTWGNHPPIFNHAGLNVKFYRYYNAETLGVDIFGLLEDLSQKIPDGDTVLFHACAHNPTGIDPSPEEWKEIASIFSSRPLIPFFDMAYQNCYKVVFSSIQNMPLRLSELKGMADRLTRMRQSLKSHLERNGSARDWSHITKQIGMFCFTGLNPKQVWPKICFETRGRNLTVPNRLTTAPLASLMMVITSSVTTIRRQFPTSPPCLGSPNVDPDDVHHVYCSSVGATRVASTFLVAVDLRRVYRRRSSSPI